MFTGGAYGHQCDAKGHRNGCVTVITVTKNHNTVANLDFSLFNERFLKELPPPSGPFASHRRHGLTNEKHHSTIRTGD